MPEETSDSPKEHLVVAGERFRVVPSLLLLLRLITSYLEVAIALPTVSSEALYRLIDLLKLWNERSSELILRAKAIEVGFAHNLSHSYSFRDGDIESCVCR